MSEVLPPLHDKVCLVTGATRGIGEASAVGLARLGATVVLAARDPARIAVTLDRLKTVNPDAAHCGLQADLSAQADVRRLAHEFLERFDRLDVLLNNVGGTFLQYAATQDRIERTWALNYLNHFLLTHLLLDRLHATAKRSGEARILEVASNMHRLARGRWQPQPGPRGYNGVMAYARSKHALVLFTCELARRLEGTAVTINAMTPGMVNTGVGGNNGLLARLAMSVIHGMALSPEEGVQPLLHLAVSPEGKAVSGAYFSKYRRVSPKKQGCNPQAQLQLWATSAEMLNLDV